MTMYVMFLLRQRRLNKFIIIIKWLEVSSQITQWHHSWTMYKWSEWGEEKSHFTKLTVFIYAVPFPQNSNNA